MPSPSRSRARARPVGGSRAAFLIAPFVTLVVVGGCARPADAPTPTAPVGSGATACQPSPVPLDNLEGWGSPATPPPVVPLIIAGPGQLVCGPNRVLFTLLDGTGTPVSAPAVKATLAIYELGRDPGKPIATVDGAFIWAIENERGIYVANLTFPESGRYGAEFAISGGSLPSETVRLTFDVQARSDVIKVGDRAPASKTPTLADVGGDPRKLSTDPDPLAAFYESSVDQALAKHEPFVLVFATPKFCTSAQCGPTLDRLKPYVARYPTVTFINVEPYKLRLVDGTLEADLDANNQLQTAPTTDEWHLLNEPSLYVVNRDGVVTANFELIFSDTELTTALDAVK